MFLTNRLKMALSVLTLSCVVILATSANAESTTRTETAQGQVGEQLADFKRAAYELRREADTLSSRRNSRVTWQTHTYHLGNLRDTVNQLGRTLSELEALKGEATEGQRMAIEHSRSHLVSVAQSTTRAFELVNDNRSSVHLPEYGEVLNDLQDHAEALHMKLDTILDFENARMRLEALELQPRPSEGS